MSRTSLWRLFYRANALSWGTYGNPKEVVLKEPFISGSSVNPFKNSPADSWCVVKPAIGFLLGVGGLLLRIVCIMFLRSPIWIRLEGVWSNRLYLGMLSIPPPLAAPPYFTNSAFFPSPPAARKSGVLVERPPNFPLLSPLGYGL